jgi:hypothetical protein
MFPWPVTMVVKVCVRCIPYNILGSHLTENTVLPFEHGRSPRYPQANLCPSQSVTLLSDTLNIGKMFLC